MTMPMGSPFSIVRSGETAAVLLGDLPGGLSLFTGAQTTTSTGTVLGLGYSDGLSVVSVFEQHGNLASGLVGWQKTTVGGHPVYAAGPDQRSLTWGCRGMVYTVMADAPPQVTGAALRDPPAVAGAAS